MPNKEEVEKDEQWTGANLLERKYGGTEEGKDWSNELLTIVVLVFYTHCIDICPTWYMDVICWCVMQYEQEVSSKTRPNIG